MKTIKFNLICDDKSIRTIDDLQNNFVIDDIIEYYHNGLLQRWLRVRGYEKELESVNLINSNLSDGEIIKKLISVFNVEMEESKIEEGIYIWNFCKEREERQNQHKNIEHNREVILNEYSRGYSDLCEKIFLNPDDAPLIKSTIANITDNYEPLFGYNHRELFYKLLSKRHKLAILCLLMNEKARKFYLPIKRKDDKDQDTLDINLLSQANKDKKDMFAEINKIVKELEDNKIETLNGNIIRNDKISEEGWTPICDKEYKCMILSMKTHDIIRPTDTIDVYGYKTSKDECCFDTFCDEYKFMIFDGIEYKTKSYSSSYTRGLIYMKI